MNAFTAPQRSAGDVGARLVIFNNGEANERSNSSACRVLSEEGGQRAATPTRHQGQPIVGEGDHDPSSQLFLDVRGAGFVRQAKEMISKSPELQKMYEKEQRQRAKLSSDAQTQKPCFDETISVQISGAK